LPGSAATANIRADADSKGGAAMIRMFVASLAALALLACGRQVEDSPPDSFTPERAGPAASAKDRVGRIYHYVRTNVDGSDPEDVYVYRKSVETLEVYKSRRKCANAAFVTATMDMARGYATKIVAGRLTRQGQQEKFASLDYDAATRTLALRVELAGQDPIERSVMVEKEPWHLYDFDLASLTVAAPRLENPREGFSFGLALVIADPGRQDPLVYLGEAEAAFRGEERRLDRATLKFALGGPAFGSFGGNLWLDAKEGHVVDVETGFPNHLEYDDFKLALRGVDDGGATAWARLLREHYEGCG
jgi:hypothetical protein